MVIIPLLLMISHRSTIENHFIFKSFMYVNHHVQKVYKSFTSSIQDTADTYLNLINTRQQNRLLVKQNQELKAKLQLFLELELENQRLFNLLNFQKDKKMHFIPAQVIGKDPVSKYQLMTINKGIAHGVSKKMLVVTEVGVVGYVFRALNHVAQVILLTDSHTALPAMVQRSRVRGIVEGAGSAFCKLKYLKRRDDVKQGDIIITSGFQFLSFKGFPIGQVMTVKKTKYGLTQNVLVKPFVNPSQLEEVLIVAHKP